MFFEICNNVVAFVQRGFPLVVDKVGDLVGAAVFDEFAICVFVRYFMIV